MIIKDNNYEYDTDYIDVAIAKGNQRDSIELDILNIFSRFAYYCYHQIRTIAEPCKCNKLTIKRVKERLDLNKIQVSLSLSEDQVHYIIEFVEEHIDAVS